MTRLLLPVLLLLAALSAPARTPIADVEEAMAWCDAHPDAPTGIWRVPEEDILVLVHEADEPGKYLLSVVESENGSMPPGRVIGEMTATPDRKSFRLKFSGRGVADKMRTLAAKLTDGGESLTIEAPSFGLRFFPLRILPYFGRMLMLSYSDPARKLPKGFLKVYPKPQEGTAAKILRL